MTGGVVSTTLTVCVATAELLQSSVTLQIYSKVYSPMQAPSILLVDGTTVRFVAQLSVAVTSAWVGTISHSTVIFVGTPISIGLIVSSMVMVTLQLVALPQSSVKEYVRVIVSGQLLLSLKSPSQATVTVPQLSVPLTRLVFGAGTSPKHSTVTLLAQVSMTGGVVSTTVTV